MLQPVLFGGLPAAQSPLQHSLCRNLHAHLGAPLLGEFVVQRGRRSVICAFCPSDLLHRPLRRRVSMRPCSCSQPIVSKFGHPFLSNPSIARRAHCLSYSSLSRDSPSLSGFASPCRLLLPGPPGTAGWTRRAESATSASSSPRLSSVAPVVCMSHTCSFAPRLQTLVPPTAG